MENDQDFHIQFSFEKERKLCNNLFSNGLINIPIKCPKCQHNVSIIQNNSLNNPYIAQCSSSKCRKKIYLRENTIFKNFSKTPISLIFFIIKLSLRHNLNATQIKEEYESNNNNVDISLAHIYDILEFMRKILATYIKDTYILEPLANENSNESISIDKSLFTHKDNQQI